MSYLATEEDIHEFIEELKNEEKIFCLDSRFHKKLTITIHGIYRVYKEGKKMIQTKDRKEALDYYNNY